MTTAIRQVRLWHADGWRICLFVRTGRKVCHLLHVPSLEHITVPVAEFGRQERAGQVQDIPISRGLARRIRFRLREARRHGRRVAEAFTKETLAMLTKVNPDPADDPGDEDFDPTDPPPPEQELPPASEPPDAPPPVSEPPTIGLSFAEMTRAVVPPGRIKPKKIQRPSNTLPLFKEISNAAF